MDEVAWGKVMYMHKAKVVVTGGIHPAGIVALQKQCTVQLWQGEGTIPRSLLYEWLQDADALVPSSGVKVDQDLLSHGPKLRVIAQSAVGYDNVDVAACLAAGVPFANTPGVLVNATADLTFALVLIAMRRLGEALDHARSGRWQEGVPLAFGTDLAEKTLGIVGMGDIGTAVARRARASQMRIVYNNRSRSSVEDALKATWMPLSQLLSEADCVVVLTPLTAQTKGMFSTKEFQSMKPGSYFVNAARGSIVDTNALVTALQQGLLSGAALDVSDPEPLPTDHPLLHMPNVVVTPHIGSATNETRRKMAELTAENILLGIEGQPLRTQVVAR